MALRRRPDGKPGAPSMLTEQTQQTLVELTARGVPVRVAAQRAGVGVTTFERWCQRGRLAQEAAEQAEANDNPDYEIPELEQPYYEFWLAIEDARATAVASQVLMLQRAAQGGIVTKETTRRFRDSVTGQVVEETTVDKTAPDWRAAAWMLERGPARQMFQKDPTAVELSGPGGGPIEMTDAGSLAERVRANMLAAQSAQAAITSGEDDGTVDGEVVEE